MYTSYHSKFQILIFRLIKDEEKMANVALIFVSWVCLKKKQQREDNHVKIVCPDSSNM